MNGNRWMLLASLALLTGCASIRGEDKASASASLGAASQYWFRGVPQSEEAVAQGDVTVAVPLKNGGTFALSTWGNWQLTNDTGDAVFPDNNGADFTEIDVTATYSQKLGEMNVSAGVINYSFPAFSGVSTQEAFLGASIDALGLTHTLTAYYDIHQADDLYLNFQAGKTFEINERTSASLSAMVGYMFEDQSEFYFGVEEAGLSDLSLNGALNYKLDDVTTLFLRGMAVTVPDSDLGDAEDARGFEEDGFVVSLGAAWSL